MNCETKYSMYNDVRGWGHIIEHLLYSTAQYSTKYVTLYKYEK
jgi:hypothetical protein